MHLIWTSLEMDFLWLPSTIKSFWVNLEKLCLIISFESVDFAKMGNLFDLPKISKKRWPYRNGHGIHDVQPGQTLVELPPVCVEPLVTISSVSCRAPPVTWRIFLGEYVIYIIYDYDCTL